MPVYIFRDFCLFSLHKYSIQNKLINPNFAAIFNAEDGFFRPSFFCTQFCPALEEVVEETTDTTVAPEDVETTTVAKPEVLKGN